MGNVTLSNVWVGNPKLLRVGGGVPLLVMVHDPWIVKDGKGFLLDPSDCSIFGTSNDDLQGSRIRLMENDKCMVMQVLKVTKDR